MEAQAGSRHLEILLLHELSAGTFARLYLAEARAPGGIERIVAVKILREQWNESAEVINRTRDEARLLARLRHKNILRVEDLSEIDGQLAIIMEFVDGLDLKQLVEALAKKGQKVPPRAALQIAAEAASALEAAYFKVPYGLDAPLHVVHRDIKPSNVMVSVEGELKVLDFGTARSSQAFRSVQTGALRFGSLKYMSPERREGDRGEHSADVYALGLMLLEILKGEWLPLLPMDVQEHDEAVADEISRLGSLGMPNREWDIALRQVLLQMLSGDAAQRPNAEQVAKLLRAFAEQASGDNLDSFAHDTVAPLARQVRGNLTGGALAGTRFVVNWFPSDGPSRSLSPTASSQGAAPAAPRPAQNLAPSRSAVPGPAASPKPAAAPSPGPARPSPAAQPASAAPATRTFDEDEESPTYAGVAGGVGASPTYSSGIRPEPAPVARSAPAVQVSPAARPDPRPAKGGNGMAIAAGGALVVLALGCAGLLGAGGVWWYLGTQPGTVPTAEAPAAPAAPSGAAATGGAADRAAVPSGTAPLTVAMQGAPVQWIKVHTVLGQQVLAGQESLDGSVAADTYELSLKQVGRPALKGSITVPASGLSLACRPGKEATVECAGGPAAIVLRP